MKLLFVFTGGTIGSTCAGAIISPDAQKPYLLLKCYAEQYPPLPDYDTVQPYTALSEHNTGEEISCLLTCVASYLEQDYDGIIITHGTDTLQYTAAALGYAFGNACIPICLVSSNYPIEHPLANGLRNLHAAVQFIGAHCGRGVFVMYHNPDAPVIAVHRGTRLLAHAVCSDRLESFSDCCYGSLDVSSFAFTRNPAFAEQPDAVSPLGAVSLQANCPEVLRIMPAPGLSYPEIPAGVRWILHESYHSGTMNTRSEAARAFCQAAQARGIPIFLIGAAQGVSYESTRDFEALGITLLPDIAPIAAYLKLWMGGAQVKSPHAWLTASLGGDCLPAENVLHG